MTVDEIMGLMETNTSHFLRPAITQERYTIIRAALEAKEAEIVALKVENVNLRAENSALKCDFSDID